VVEHTVERTLGLGRIVERLGRTVGHRLGQLRLRILGHRRVVEACMRAGRLGRGLLRILADTLERRLGRLAYILAYRLVLGQIHILENRLGQLVAVEHMPGHRLEQVQHRILEHRLVGRQQLELRILEHRQVLVRHHIRRHKLVVGRPLVGHRLEHKLELERLHILEHRQEQLRHKMGRTGQLGHTGLVEHMLGHTEQLVHRLEQRPGLA